MNKGQRQLTKSSRTTPSANPEYEILAHAGEGLENVRDVFRPPLPGDKLDEVFDWFWACERTDEAKGKHKSELLELLRSSGRPFPPTARMCVADLLERYRLMIWTQLKGRYGPITAEEENTEQKVHFVKLLRSTEPTSGAMRAALAHMLMTHELKRRPGKQPTPFYRVPNSEWVLELAGYEVRRLRKAKVSIEKALAQVAKSRSIKRAVLETFWKKRRGSTRKLKQSAALSPTQGSKAAD